MTRPRRAGRLRADLGLLRRPRFALLFAGRTSSMFGNAFGPIAIAFGVLGLPGATPATLSIVLAGHAVPQLALLLIGGVIGDRFPRHRVLVAAELLAGLAFAALAVMLLAGWAPVPLLTAAAFLAGAASALFLPALTKVVPEVVERADLQPANALLRLGSNAATIGGMLLAGAVVALLGPGVALAIDAGTFVVAAALLAGLGRLPSPGRLPGPGRLPIVPGDGRPAAARGSVLGDLRDGFVAFFRRQWLWTVVLAAAFLQAGSAAAFGVLGPVLAAERLGGAVAWSFILAGYAAGMLTSVLAAIRARPSRPLRAAVLVTPALAAPLLALGLAAPLPVVIAAAFLAGAAFNVFGVLWETTLQRHVPTALLARITSCNYLVALSLRPLGIVLAGSVAAAAGARPTVLLLAAVLLVAGLVTLASPQVRRLPAEPAGPPPTGTEIVDDRAVR